MSNIIQTIQTLEPGAIVHLYEFEMADGTFKYFAPYNNSNLAPIQMYDYDDKVIEVEVLSGISGEDMTTEIIQLDRKTLEIIK